MAAYGVDQTQRSTPWHRGDPRFDHRAEPERAEPLRLGGRDRSVPTRRPRPIKRTALGRMKHENAAFAESADGRAVDLHGRRRAVPAALQVRLRPAVEADGAAGPARSTRAPCTSPGSTPDGTGVWLPLARRHRARATSDLASILIDTRGAAAAVGATPMDRPEWVAVHPTHPGPRVRHVHQQHGTDDAGPRQPAGRPEPSGHILRWQNAGGDHGAETFTWSIFALAGAGLGTGDGSTIAPGDAFGSPDGLAVRRRPGGCGSRPTAASRSPATTRCSSLTRRRATSAGSWSARPAARSPAGPSATTGGRCS